MVLMFPSFISQIYGDIPILLAKFDFGLGFTMFTEMSYFEIRPCFIFPEMRFLGKGA